MVLGIEINKFKSYI